MANTIIHGAYVVTVTGEEHADGYVAFKGGAITAVGNGEIPAELLPAATLVDGRGLVVTPGLINTHHHLFQWATRGYAADHGLFDWLTTLYPIWGHLDEGLVHSAATAGLGKLALSGCTLAADHAYLFPRDGGDVFGAVVAAANRIGIRLHGVRGSMDRGRSAGGLPPDHVVETLDGALKGTQDAIDKHHDRSPGARIQVAVGPCSPFSVSRELMAQAAVLARANGVRMHTHLAETKDEDEQCLREFGQTPVQYAESLGWLGDDVWHAHTVHLSAADILSFASTGTSSAHCPSSNARLGSGIAPVSAMRRAGVAVGLGVDGVASNENGALFDEVRQALYLARVEGGPTAMPVREALWMGTMGGAHALGRSADVGSIEVGKRADLAVWRLDPLDHGGIADPVTALVLGPTAQVAALYVEGSQVVTDGQLLADGNEKIGIELTAASLELARRAGVIA
jgi:cytosine/adenosine deaminase-related metal-dependent hydrolase